jgi:hypothetical protein
MGPRRFVALFSLSLLTAACGGSAAQRAALHLQAVNRTQGASGVPAATTAGTPEAATGAAEAAPAPADPGPE